MTRPADARLVRALRELLDAAAERGVRVNVSIHGACSDVGESRGNAVVCCHGDRHATCDERALLVGDESIPVLPARPATDAEIASMRPEAHEPHCPLFRAPSASSEAA